MSKPANSPKKIVLADDSVTMHRAVKLGLKKEPFEVICCDNGADAWRIVKMEKPDAVLADLDMPGMTGAELCQKIKNDPQLRHIPVILVCGSFDQVDEKHLESVPSDARLWKPFETHVLTTLLTKVLGTESSLRESNEPTAIAATKPPPPPPKGRMSAEPTASHSPAVKTPFEKTQSTFEPTFSQHLSEPAVGSRSVEMPDLDDESHNRQLHGFQDLPYSDSESVMRTMQVTEIRSPATTPEETEQESYENLWSSDPLQTSATETTQAFSRSEITAEKKASDSDWPSFDDSEKSFSTEVFEAVETRNFEEEELDSARASSEATEAISSLREGHDATQMFGSNDSDLQGYREETSQSHLPQSPAAPQYQRTSIVEHTSALASGILQQQTKMGLGEDEIRKIIREEIQTAISGWLKNRLHQELERVIEEIDRE